MAKCINCGKKGLFLKLKDGLCRDCYVEMIKSQNKEEAYRSFLDENAEIIKTIEYEIEKNRKIIENTLSDEEKTKLLKINADLLKELEDFCISKGEEGKAFFQKNHMQHKNK